MEESLTVLNRGHGWLDECDKGSDVALERDAVILVRDNNVGLFCPHAFIVFLFECVAGDAVLVINDGSDCPHVFLSAGFPATQSGDFVADLCVWGLLCRCLVLVLFLVHCHYILNDLFYLHYQSVVLNRGHYVIDVAKVSSFFQLTK